MGLLQTSFFQRALATSWVVTLLKRLVPPLDTFLLKISRGWLNTAMQPVLLLKTIGAKSGEPRQIALICMPVDGGMVLVGSNWGGERSPAWVYNLRATPQAQVLFRGYVGQVDARELDGDERAEVWQRLIEFNPQYTVYQAGTERVLPVILLCKSAA